MDRPKFSTVFHHYDVKTRAWSHFHSCLAGKRGYECNFEEFQFFLTFLTLFYPLSLHFLIKTFITLISPPLSHSFLWLKRLVRCVSACKAKIVCTISPECVREMKKAGCAAMFKNIQEKHEFRAILLPKLTSFPLFCSIQTFCPESIA